MTSGTPDKIGSYKLLEKIGQGGMGTLYRALDPKIGRHVAIKLIREGADTSEMRDRLLREARSAGGLKHGNIVTIFELGEHEGQPFIAMEYIQGETLTTFLTHRPTAPLHRKLQIIDQLCAGLHYAHRMGVVHRDIKPANIMIDTEGTVKILDFGIARMGASGTTLMGMMIGTLNYMAPEQMEGKSVDARADIFSVGAVIYELFTYRPAFAGSMQSEVMYAILHGRPKPLADACQGLDAELIGIVDRCLEKRPEDRFQDLAAMRQAIGSARQRIERTASTATVLAPLPGVPAPPPGAGAARQSHTPATPPPQTPAPGSRRDSSGVNRLRDRADQMRTEQIQAHLERGRHALENGDHDGAFSACEQVFVLEPQNLQALDLEERTRAAVEQVWLREAQNDLERGALTSAWLLTERVLGMNADSPQVQTLRQAIEAARAKQAEAAAMANQRAVEQAREAERRREEAERQRLERERQDAEARRQADAQRQADMQRQAEARRQQAEAARQRMEAERQRQIHEATERRLADLPLRTPEPAPAPLPPPVHATPPPQKPKRGFRLQIIIQWGSAAGVLVAALVVGVRLATNNPVPTQPEVAPAATPPSASQPQAAVEPVGQQPASQPTSTIAAARPGRSAEARTLPPIGPPNVIPPPPDAPPAPAPPAAQAPEPPRATAPAPSTPPAPPSASDGDRVLADQYGRAKAALDSGAFANAITLFEGLQRDEPGYRDVPTQLARARDGVATSVKQAMDNAAKLESSGDLPEAMKQLERVSQIDPSMAIVAERAVARLKARMKTEGTAAFTSARQYDAVERVDDAIKWYDRAFRLLPDDDPNKEIARDRLNALRARK